MHINLHLSFLYKFPIISQSNELNPVYKIVYSSIQKQKENIPQHPKNTQQTKQVCTKKALQSGPFEEEEIFCVKFKAM